MSVLIKGMEIPKSCGDCLTNYMLNVVCDCDLNNIEDGMRLPNCPLIEVLPHGRLIDADALIRQMNQKVEETNNVRYAWVNEMDISLADTIIEAEGEDD